MGGADGQAGHLGQEQAARLADVVGGIGIANAGERMIGAGRLDEGIGGGHRQRDGARPRDRQAGQEGVAEAPGAGRGVAIGHREGSDRAVADLHAQLAREVAGVVDEVAVAAEERDLLERHDVGVQPGHERADRPEAIGVDPGPPSVREGPGTDCGADVPGDDAELHAPPMMKPPSPFT